ncbi:MAG: hypothetical protein MAG451_03052 [Anaerolineales bacterium]|nr:hypothetical protein [Anaerolineales bacterium]
MRIRLNVVTAIISILIALCMLILGATGARGNGVPVKVFLDYLPDVSNSGPETGRGEAVLAVAEGWATISVEGLPKLQDEVYVAWIVPHQGAAIPIGRFNTDRAGTGDFAIRELSVPDKPYKLFLITIEQDSVQYQAPGDRRSIAGRFPDPALRGAPPPTPTAFSGSEDSSGQVPDTGNTDSGTDTSSSLIQPVPTQPVPLTLPVTGGPERSGWEGEGGKGRSGWRVASLAGLVLVSLVGFGAFQGRDRS